ncbi:MAG: pimeloyl-ACP methyl ester carboxylesterase [Gammaproteobacteria bacterium]|jgi:pimeloyl-ACP methyl ester carboxylesterase
MTELVLIPGLLCTELLWQHQIRHLNDVADMIVPDVSGANSITQLAQAVLDNSPAQFALCGLSMGGIISHEIMRIAPERVTKLALLDTTARPEMPEQTVKRKGLLAMADRGEFAQVPMAIMPALVHRDRATDITLSTEICAMAAEVGVAAFRRQVAAIIGRPDARERLRGYACPTLVLCGREDAITTLEMHEEMANAIPNAKLAVIEQCGHVATMERPQAVTALLRQWLLYG